jgi:hypothetical protein
MDADSSAMSLLFTSTEAEHAHKDKMVMHTTSSFIAKAFCFIASSNHS